MTSPSGAAADLRLPQELLGSLPRDVRLTGGGIAVASLAVAAAVGALMAGIVMSAIYVRASAERQLRERDAVTAEARVVQIQERRSDGPRRVVTYRYDVNGRGYTGRTALRNSDRRPMTQGAAVHIAFVPSEPERSWMIGYARTGFPLWLIPLTVFSLATTALALFWSLRRQWMLSEGRVARAQVTALKRVSGHEGKRYRVTYEFQTISGARQHSRSDVGKAPPAIGATIPVLYHRDQPEWSATYPMQLVRPALRN